MSRTKAWSWDSMVEESGERFQDEGDIHYEDARTGHILSLEEWNRLFNAMGNPCKWYNCRGKDCDHPEHLEPGECFLTEVEIVGFDTDGCAIWERV